MQNFKKIDRKKTKLFSIENLIHCFCARLYTDDKSASACAYKCGIINYCEWYSFDGVTASCTLTSDCSKVVDYDLCVHGEKRCGYVNEGKIKFKKLHKNNSPNCNC